MKICINGLWVSSISEDFKEVKYTDDKEYALNVQELQFAKLVLHLVEIGKPTYAIEIHLIQEEKKINFATIGEILKNHVKVDFEVKQFDKPRVVLFDNRFIANVFSKSYASSPDRRDAEKLDNNKIIELIDILFTFWPKLYIYQDTAEILELSHEQK